MIDTDRCASFPVAKSVRQDVTPVSPGTEEKCRISNPGSPPIPESIAQQQVTHDGMSQKHPYPSKGALSSSPKASRLSTQFMKQGLQLEQLSQEDKECLDSGLLQMSPTIMYEGFSTMLAAREAARQRLLSTAWEIEEAKRLSRFLGHIQVEHEGRLSRADKLLQGVKSFFAHCSRANVEGSKDYLQAIQEDESEAFQLITAQAKHVSNLLGRSVTQSFLRFTGDPSSQPSDTFPCFANAGEPSDPEGLYRGEYILHDSDVDSEESDD